MLLQTIFSEANWPFL